MMSFRKIDLFIGRHMSAKRWIVVYSAIALGGYVLVFACRGWWGFLALPIVALGTFGIVGHARRLR